MDEPIADEVRGILDGHVVLDRGLAARGHHPAIDPLESLSRVMPAVTGEAHRAAAARLRALLAAYERHRDLITVGAYRPGADPDTDVALARLPAIEAFLRQRPGEEEPFDAVIARLVELVG
jgi:type III secretion protein N (ATPase)